MINLRLTNHQVVDSTHIILTFTDNVRTTVNTSNVSIVSEIAGVSDAVVVNVTVSGKKLELETTPLVPLAMYMLSIAGNSLSPFVSENGHILFEDGSTNRIRIIGPNSADNVILDRFLRFYEKNIYDMDDPTSSNRSYINILSEALDHALNSINQIRTDGLLSITVTDEAHIRGNGPFDRFDNEGVYEIIRVGENDSQYIYEGTINVEFSDPVTLQRKVVTNELLIAGDGSPGTFNKTVYSLRNSNVTKILDVVVTYPSGVIPVATYQTSIYGYKLKNGRYDKYASTYVTLEDNQFSLSEKSIIDGFQVPQNGDTVSVTYEYKDVGVSVDPTSVVLTNVDRSIREVVPPIATSFSLKYSNITNAQGVTPTSGGVTFYNPQSNPPYQTNHPAFVDEITYNASKPPSTIGQYAIDYATGKVYVYGADETDTNVGSGIFPPVCSYYYKNTFEDGVDYTYDSSLQEVAIRNRRDILNKNVTIEFDYSQDYVSGIDFVPQIHSESLNERVDNRLYGLGTITTEHGPITNVFRIYNETTGEVYRLNRFRGNKVYFQYRNPPTLVSATEQAVFEDVFNELLVPDYRLTNGGGIDILQINLASANIISNTNDCVGSSINTSITFSNTDIFATELYFSKFITVEENLDRLTLPGQYIVDYANGVAYVVINTSVDDIGYVSYKSKYIKPKHEHIISVKNVYVKTEDGKTHFSYNTFDDTHIDLQSYLSSDERYLSTNPDVPFTVSSDMVDMPSGAVYLRKLIEVHDLISYSNPINFATGSSIENGVATLAPVEFISTETLLLGNTISLTQTASNAYIEIDSIISIKSNGVEVYNTSAADGSFVGSVITLPSDTTAIVGDELYVIVKLRLIDTAPVIADINYGGLFVEYTYLYDEILVSYEYGDNVLDFSTSTTIHSGQTYYVSYKYGALRDGLLANFGSSIDIDALKNFDVDLTRERYRDALLAVFHNFHRGSTVGSIKDIAKKITHVTPELVETMYQEWSLGSSRLYNDDIEVTGCSILPGKFGGGLYVEGDDDLVKIPALSRIKFNNGTLEFWVKPNWNGLDNDAIISFANLKRDGVSLVPENVYIGATGFNPDSIDFSLNKLDDDSPIGEPYNLNLPNIFGIFVYFSLEYNKWIIVSKDVDGTYTGDITSNGIFYNVLSDPAFSTRTTSSKISFTMSVDGYDGYDGYNNFIDGYDSYDGYDGYDGYTNVLEFRSDLERYLFDYGQTPNENRISIYKDGKGYLSLRVYGEKDRLGVARKYEISHSIADWVIGDEHFIAVSNKINNGSDELHFFVDGFEVPNIIKFGTKYEPPYGSKFGDVIPEIVVGTVTSNTLASNDLITVLGSDVVTSNSVDFGLAGIQAGDIFYIEATGFASSYTIVDAGGPGSEHGFHTLQLDAPMPVSLTDVSYSINKWTAPVSTDLMYESNLLVTRFDGIDEYELPGLRATVPAYSVSVDSFGQPSIVIRSEAQAGDQIYIRTLGLKYRFVNQRIYNWGSTNIIKCNLPPPVNLDYVKMHAVNKVKYVVNATTPSVGSTTGTVLIVGNTITVTGITPDTRTSSTVGGRTLSIKIGGDNVNYSISPTITINGSTYSGAASETLTLTGNSVFDTVEQFRTITSFDITVEVFDNTKPSISFEVIEKYQINKPENGADVPIIRYSKMELGGSTFDGIANIITNTNATFYESDVGKSIVVTSPLASVGTYVITHILSSTSVMVSPIVAADFIGGTAKMYNVSISRSGFQNGEIYLEYAGSVGVPFNLYGGYYDVSYAANLTIPFEFDVDYANLGTDYNGGHHAKAIIDEIRCLAIPSTDTRVGEVTVGNSITSDYEQVIAFEPDADTTLLVRANEINVVDIADPYSRYSNQFVQVDSSLNSNFDKAAYFDTKPLELDNDNILFGNAGSIEFWVNLNNDSANDPHNRYLFDANSSVVEALTSTTKITIVLPVRAKTVFEVRLIGDKSRTGTNYALGGTISTDGRTFTTGIPLPNQQIKIVVTYAPYGVVGTRISIYKDNNSACKFVISVGTRSYTLTTPVFWSRNTWHRVMATWDFRVARNGKMHLFVDGEEKVLPSAGILAGVVSGTVGPSTATNLNLKITDQFQKLYIGGNFLGGNIAECKLDNFRISREPRAYVVVNGQPIDINYNSNIAAVMPVTEDLYSTYLSDFGAESYLIDDFAYLKDKITGIFDFDLLVYDSFDILEENPRSKEILEELVKLLKLANSRAFIKYQQ